jgi:hypothetical protein
VRGRVTRRTRRLATRNLGPIDRGLLVAQQRQQMAALVRDGLLTAD